MKAEIGERIEQVRRGEVPEGYKHTKAMLFPIEWPLVSLNNLLSENKDRNYESLFDRNDVLSVSGDCGIVNQIDFLGRSYAGESILNYHVVYPGNIVYTKSPLKENPYGIIKLNKGDSGVVSTLYAVYNCNSPVTALYLDYYFSVNKYLNNYLRPLVKKGAKNDMKVNNEDVLRGLLPLPLTSEQEKITEVLTHCDQVIDLKKQLIEEKRRQKKWLMQNLLNPDSGVRMPGFERSKWKKESFSKLFSFGASLSASRQNLSDKGICYLHYGDIHSNNEYFIDVTEKEHMLPKLDVNKPVSKYLLNDGDVVFVDASEDYEGASKYVVINNPNRIPFVSGLHTIPAHSISNVLSNAFKRYCFQSQDVKIQIAFYASGMKVLGINKENLCKITLVYPSFSEQLAITSVLVAADREIKLLEQEYAQWQAKKKALMQLLLTGIVRVN